MTDERTYYLKEIAHYAYAGDTPLHMAAAAYQRDIADELVSRDANVDAINRRGAEPLHYAADGNSGLPAWHSDAQYAVVEFLIAAGADVNTEDKSGVAPLHRAVRTRCTAAVRALLVNGADAPGKTRAARPPFIWRFRTPAVAARVPRRRAKSKASSSDCFSITAPALPTEIPPADPSRLALQGRLDSGVTHAQPIVLRIAFLYRQLGFRDVAPYRYNPVRKASFMELDLNRPPDSLAPVLILRGLYNSGPEHWQSRWGAAHPELRRVMQDDWERPRCADWIARTPCRD